MNSLNDTNPNSLDTFIPSSIDLHRSILVNYLSWIIQKAPFARFV